MNYRFFDTLSITNSPIPYTICSVKDRAKIFYFNVN
nr:MAG TPA: hypothetical protein [Caudoviricetes sp.]